MEAIKIRRATLADMEILLQFEQGVISAERPFDATLQPGTIHYYDIAEMITASYIELVVAEYSNNVIASGYARIEKAKPYLIHPQHAYVGFMYVLPEYRGKGVNKKIINSLSDWAVSQNIRELRLDVYNDNLPAIKAYENAGFNRHMIEMRLGLTDT